MFCVAMLPGDLVFIFFFPAKEKGEREDLSPSFSFSLSLSLAPPPSPAKHGLRRRLPRRLGGAGRALFGQATEAPQDDEVFQGALKVSSRHEQGQLERDARLDCAQDRGAALLRGRGAQRLHRRAAGRAGGKIGEWGKREKREEHRASERFTPFSSLPLTSFPSPSLKTKKNSPSTRASSRST